MTDDSNRPNAYGELSRAQLETRLAAAEAVCIMFAWNPARMRNTFDSEDALTELWQQWMRLVPEEFTSPQVQAELYESIPALAGKRRAARQATLRRIGPAAERSTAGGA